MGQPVLGGSGRFCSGPGSGLGRGRPFGEPCGPTLTTGVLKVRSYSTVSRTRLQASLAAPCPCGWTTDSGVCLHSVLPGSPGRPPGIPPDQIRAGGPTPAPPPNEPRHPISIPEARPAPGRTLRVPELPIAPAGGQGPLSASARRPLRKAAIPPWTARGSGSPDAGTTASGRRAGGRGGSPERWGRGPSHATAAGGHRPRDEGAWAGTPPTSPGRRGHGTQKTTDRFSRLRGDRRG